MGTRLDGRYGALDFPALEQAIDFLVANTNMSDGQYVLGIPEGGMVPAYAFAHKKKCPLVFASYYRPAEGEYITFQEEHDAANDGGRYIFGLKPGDSVTIVEDEVTTGKTAVNCVRALREAGVECNTIAAIYAADLDSTRRVLQENGISLVASALFGDEFLRVLYD